MLAQEAFTVTYDFTSMGATVSGSTEVTALSCVVGGAKLTPVGLVTDGGECAYQATVVKNNNTNYSLTNFRFDLAPKKGAVLGITKITVTQRSSIPGVAGKSQTYLFRMGCALNGAYPVTSNSDQSTVNTLLYDSYHADEFSPGDFASVSGDDFLSVWLTARGENATNDSFDWYVDKVEIEGTTEKLLDLPAFNVRYAFDGGSKAAVISGTQGLSASSMSSNSNAEGTTTSGLYWIEIKSNTNSIGFNKMGLHFDIAPPSGYELLIGDYVLTHAGSGVAGESRVSRIAVYRDVFRSNSGVEVGREDFSAYTGRNIYADNVSEEDYKVTTIEDDIIIDQTYYYTLSVNRSGSPTSKEQWTVDDVTVSGWLIKAGRSNLLLTIRDGEELLSSAKVGSGDGEYSEAAYDAYYAVLKSAVTVLNDASASTSAVDVSLSEVEEAMAVFHLL